MTLALILTAIALCMALSFYFSGAEVAIVSANRYRLRSMEEQGDASAGRLVELLEDSQRLLVMALVGTNLANVLTALFFKLFLQRGWPELAATEALGVILWSEVLSLLILTPILIVFAEILPKALFRAHADALIHRLHFSLRLCLVLLKPVIWSIERVAQLILSPWSESHRATMRQLTREDVITLLSPEPAAAADSTTADAVEETIAHDAAERERHEPFGEAIAREHDGEEERLSESADQRRMIQNIIELHETLAREIMTPLVDLVAVDLKRYDLNMLKSLAQQSGFSRFPVYRDRIVNLIGYVDIFRVLREDDGTRKLEDFIERAHFVPETKRVDDLLEEFLQMRIKNAIVVNEYGGCSGWISREDMLEEIVGELEDELDEPGDEIVEQAEGVYLADGRT